MAMTCWRWNPFGHDARHRLESVTAGNGSMVDYSYDAGDRVVKRKNVGIWGIILVSRVMGRACCGLQRR